MNVGPGEVLLIAVLALLIFGPKRLPEIARTAGRALREFRKITAEVTSELRSELDDTPGPPKPTKPTGEPPKPGPRV